MPLIIFKTITQQTFELELPDDTTIAESKGNNEFAVELQKLIYNGKILEDGQTLGELNIDPKKFVVVMVSRKKADPTASASTQAVATSEPTAAPTPTPAAMAAAEKAPSSSSTTGNQPPLDAIPQEHLPTVDTITAMGYPREEVIRALKVSFFNAERAIEYLCNGIPEALNLEDVIGGAGGEAVAAAELGEEESDAAEDGGAGLEFLQNSPQFQNLRELVRSNPALLPQIVQQIAASNPELMDAIRNNQEEFLQLLNAPPLGGAGVGTGAAAAAGGAAPPGGCTAAAAAPGVAAPPGVVTISVSEEDRNAIQRLMTMGFPEQLVIEAYLTCDKNEELAINYILTRMEEFNAEANQGSGGS